MPAKLKAAGTGRWLQIGGDTADGIRISGTGAQLLARLPGRSGHPGGTCPARAGPASNHRDDLPHLMSASPPPGVHVSRRLPASAAPLPPPGGRRSFGAAGYDQGPGRCSRGCATLQEVALGFGPRATRGRRRGRQPLGPGSQEGGTPADPLAVVRCGNGTPAVRSVTTSWTVTWTHCCAPTLAWPSARPGRGTEGKADDLLTGGSRPLQEAA
jgi:hypothetical protein